MRNAVRVLCFAIAAFAAIDAPLRAAPVMPSVDATAAPTPTGALLRFAGQVLDLRSGFVFFTTGDGFALDPQYRTLDASTGAPSTQPVVTGMYASAAFDPQTGNVVELSVSQKPLPPSAAYGDIRRFAVALSTPYANPELAPKPGAVAGGAYTGRRVLVQFTVQVPPTTPLTDDVYITTDQSQWEPMAIKLVRIDALHYRINEQFASGTKLLYLYTRGAWRSVERGQDGLERKARTFVVGENDTQSHSDVVYHWADENQGAPQAEPGAIPTPFNPSPFVRPQ